MSRGYLLDTNVPSEQMRSRSNPAIGRWVYSQAEETLFLSSVTIGELNKGILLLPLGRRRTQLEAWFEGDLIPRFSARTLAVTQAIGRRWGQLSAIRQLAGRPLAMADGLIAATALEHDLVIVTRNVKDFVGLGLVILNPWEV